MRALVLFVLSALLLAQDSRQIFSEPKGSLNLQRVSSQVMYHRVYAVVPIVGSGSADDPKRPMFAPTAKEMAADHSGVIGYQMLLTDDKTRAIVEFVGTSRKDLMPIINSTAPGVIVFERGKVSAATVEAT